MHVAAHHAAAERRQVGLTFIFNFLASVTDFLYLDSFATIFFILMLASAAALIAWAYCSFTGVRY